MLNKAKIRKFKEKYPDVVGDDGHISLMQCGYYMEDLEALDNFNKNTKLKDEFIYDFRMLEDHRYEKIKRLIEDDEQ